MRLQLSNCADPALDYRGEARTPGRGLNGAQQEDPDILTRRELSHVLPPVGPLGRVPGWGEGEGQGWGGAVTSQPWPGALARELLARLTATLEEQGPVLGAGFAP